MSRLKHSLAKEFEIKDLGELRYFLEWKWQDQRRALWFYNGSTFLISKKTKMSGCKTSSTPIKANAKLREVKDGVPVETSRYQRLVGKLTHTRPDTTLVVSMVSQLMESPYEEHIKVVY